MKFTDQASPKSCRDVFHVVISGQAERASFTLHPILFDVLWRDHVVEFVINIGFFTGKHARNQKLAVFQREKNLETLQ